MNPFKQAIWTNFWDKNTEKDTLVLINLLIKEAVGKLPHNRLDILDKYKIRRIDLDFNKRDTLLQLNECTNIINIGNVDNMTCFVSLTNIEIISISYYNPSVTVDNTDELVLEKSLKKTNLFESFNHLQKVELIENCKGGARKIDVNRKDILKK